MSLIPFAPFKLVRCPRFDSCAPSHFDLSVCPSMLLASPRLHSRSEPRHFTLCRSSDSLHSGDVMANDQSALSRTTRSYHVAIRDPRIATFARSRSQYLTLQAPRIAGRTSHSDVATSVGRIQPVRLRSRHGRQTGQAYRRLQQTLSQLPRCYT
jgi:hypothetical protein